jgi:predicted metal-dependent enzyme (double-stranded beta helix superfamily)
MVTVVYPPGASDPVHRHNAYAFVYLLEGFWPEREQHYASKTLQWKLDEPSDCRPIRYGQHGFIWSACGI